MQWRASLMKQWIEIGFKGEEIDKMQTSLPRSGVKEREKRAKTKGTWKEKKGTELKEKFSKMEGTQSCLNSDTDKRKRLKIQTGEGKSSTEKS